VRKALFLLAVAVAGFAAFLAYLGYFGGPVFEDFTPTARPAPAVAGLGAVLLSGDMGMRVGMGPKISARLAAEGIPVVGINSLSFFRTERSPADNRALIVSAMRRALAIRGVTHLVLIGQSFGADMLQAGLPALPAAMRARVSLIALVVPGDTLDFRASPSELFNLRRPDAEALPSARRLSWAPLLCVYGVEETDSLCPLLRLRNARVVALPGGHFLNRDIRRVEREILGAIADLGRRPQPAPDVVNRSVS
jgi:type IV secretory pathway VirJ component